MPAFGCPSVPQRRLTHHLQPSVYRTTFAPRIDSTHQRQRCGRCDRLIVWAKGTKKGKDKGKDNSEVETLAREDDNEEEYEPIADAKSRMEGALDATSQELAGVRTGRAQTAMLDNVKVEYYGEPTPLNQMATISAPSADTLLVSPYDPSAMDIVEKGIQMANLGFNPNNDGKVIRINVPQLTEDRRKEMVKFAHDKGEAGKVAVRNVRKDVMKKVAKTVKKLKLSDDDKKLMEDEVQEVTDKYVAEIDDMIERKDKELSTL